MKTDSIFYRLFQEFPNIFFELIGNSPETATGYEFSSVEVKQTAFRIDGVFLPETEEKPIYFLEVQFQADSEIYSRLFTEVHLYLRQNQPENDWFAVVIYPTRSIDSAKTKHYRESFASGRVTRIYLDELGETASLPIGIATIKLVVENEDKAIQEARELITRTRQEVDSVRKKQQLLQLIETILVYKFPSMDIEEIQEMFGLSDLKQTRVYQQAFAEGEQKGEQKGKQEGKREGEQEGERRGKLLAVPPMLAAGLTVEQIAQALSLTVDEVRQAGQ
ncbi:MAG: Rpn family recombination-promoting nuclease/putative transposase [Tolypothrix brevis GSE-NOS-MK-07-07A]|nr:Rpn family recombination-promoting nuclease/putative transposase [Tolypothrix brevis GSE-NOS-MK-07-07A]